MSRGSPRRAVRCVIDQSAASWPTNEFDAQLIAVVTHCRAKAGEYRRERGYACCQLAIIGVALVLRNTRSPRSGLEDAALGRRSDGALAECILRARDLAHERIGGEETIAMLSLAARRPAMAHGSGRRECKAATSGAYDRLASMPRYITRTFAFRNGRFVALVDGGCDVPQHRRRWSCFAGTHAPSDRGRHGTTGLSGSFNLPLSSCHTEAPWAIGPARAPNVLLCAVLVLGLTVSRP